MCNSRRPKLPHGDTGRHYGRDVNAGAEYDAEEVEFIRAMDRYIHDTGRKYPTFAEVLRVARSLGWRKVAPPAGGISHDPSD